MSAGPCRYFLSQGKCFYGNDCKFEHSAAASAGAGADVPASAAPAATATAAAPSKGLAAGAKAWTPSAAVESFVPASSSSAVGLTVPAAAASSADPSSPAPGPSKSPGLGGAGLKLNPNKTPFKPGGSAAVGVAAPSAKLSTAVPAFVPSASPVYTDSASASYPTDASADSSSHHDHYGADDSFHPALDPSHYGAADESENPYADAGQHEPFGGSMMHHAHEMHGDEAVHAHAAEAGGYVAPDAYTSYADFAAHSAPLRNTATSSAGSIPRAASSQQPGGGGPGLFMDQALRSRLELWSHLAVARLQPDDPLFAALPTSLDHDRYHSLLPLPADEPPAGHAVAAPAAGAASSSSASASAAASASASSWYAKSLGGSVSYKVVSAMDGRSYVVKRLLHCKLSEDSARALLAPWLALQAQYGSGSAPGSPELALSAAWGAGASHPHLIALRGLFLSKDFGNDAASLPVGVTPPPSSAGPAQLCLVYDYHPTAAAVAPLTAEGASKSVEELWGTFLQLLTALAALHENHRAAGGMLQPGRVLSTSDGRIRLSCMGLADLLSPAPASSAAAATGAASAQASKAQELELAKAQSQDIKSLALLMLGWMGFSSQAQQIWGILHPVAAGAAGAGAQGSGGTPSKAATAAAAAAAAAQASAVSSAFAALLPALTLAFPAELVALLSSLFRPETTVATLQSALAPRLMRALTTAQSRVDHTESEVGRELANGRLVRLLIKLGFVCDRPAESVAAALHSKYERTSHKQASILCVPLTLCLLSLSVLFARARTVPPVCPVGAKPAIVTCCPSFETSCSTPRRLLCPARLLPTSIGAMCCGS